MSAALWIGWVVAFFVLEFAGIAREDDNAYPLTYYVRRVFGLGRGWRSVFTPGWFVAATFIGWLALHFLVEQR